MTEKILLTLISDPDPGREYLLEPDDDLHLTVGRSPDCEICVDHPTVSRRHLEIFWSGETFRLKDVGSSNGTFVNDEKVEEAKIGDDDELRAGDVVFKLAAVEVDVLPTVEGRLVPLPPAPPIIAPILSRQKMESPEPATVFRPCEPIEPVAILFSVDPVFAPELDGVPEAGDRLERLLDWIDRDRRLYAVVDGAEIFELVVMGRLMGHDVYTLLAVATAAEHATSGPGLVVVGEPGGYLQRWDGQIGNNAGVLFESDADFADLFAHLRQLLLVTDQQRQEYVLPYFDPRVFRDVLPSYTAPQLEAFFGPIARWVCEDDDGTGYLAFEFTGDQVLTTAI